MKTISLIIFAFLSQITLSQEEIKSNSNETSKNTEITKTMEVLVSPNPAIDKCIVTGEEGATCIVYSSTGTYVGKWVFDSSNTVLLTDLPTGVLQAIIEKNGCVVVKRIVVI